MSADDFWLITSLIGVVVLGYFGLRRVQNRRAARTWPTVTGSVTSTRIELQERGEQSMHVAIVAYSYSVRGEAHIGQASRDFLLHGRAEKWIARYPKGAAVNVRSNPGNAVESMLFDDDQPEPGEGV